MKKIMLIIIFIFGVCFGQIRYSTQDVLNDVHDKTNNALQSSVTKHYANDGMYDAVTVVDHLINSLNTGELFNFTIVDTDLDNVDSLIVAFVTPNSAKDVHLSFTIRTTLAGTYYLLEEPTITSGSGTDALVVQMNRGSSITSTILSSKDSTVAKVTVISLGILSGLGTTLDSRTFSAVTQEFVSDEWILDTYKRYAIMLISSTDNAFASINIRLIEHTPDDD